MAKDIAGRMTERCHPMGVRDELRVVRLHMTAVTIMARGVIFRWLDRNETG